MKHIIYKTTNLVNGHFYYGVHRFIDKEDVYLGSGKLLLKAIDKLEKEKGSGTCSMK